MKRTCLILCIILCGMYTSFAQTEHGVRSTNPADTSRYLVSKISQNWFISAYGSANWWQGSDRNPAGNYTKLNGPTFGGGFAVGKWITHKSAFRLSYDVNRSHSYIDGLHSSTVGDKFRFLYDNNPTPDANGYCTTTFMYHNIHGDFMLSPIDIILNYYNPQRFYTPVVYVGLGLATVSGHASLIQSTLVDGRYNIEISANAGLINQFHLNKYFDITLAFNWSAQKYSIDSWYNEYGAHGVADPRPRRADYNYSVDAGLTWYIGGRIYELPYKYVEVLKETTEIIKHIHDTIPCQEEPIVNVSGNDTITEIISYPLSIFFRLDKSDLMSGRDKVNLQEIANVVKAKRLTVHLRGSCDSATATAEYNKGLALRRCNTIMNILMDMGVPEELIEIEPVGGVKELNPTEYDRRVIITLGKRINNN